MKTLLFTNTSCFLSVSSENKRDQRTIEQVLADTKARKKQKLDANQSTSTENGDKPETQSSTISTTIPVCTKISESDLPSSTT